MDGGNRIFLTRSQALDAIAIDFEQYGPQPGLFTALTPLVLRERYKVISDGPRPLFLIQPLHGGQFEQMRDTDLGAYLHHTLETYPFDPDRMAEICTLVFQARTRPGQSAPAGETGFWIENHMDTFTCSQCGECCRTLERETILTQADYRLWQEQGRRDILEWVRIETVPDGPPRYRFWVDPNTGETAASCPFLAPVAGSTKTVCLIQDVKPEVCRQYPYTKKHALMTGCRGSFDPVRTRLPA